MRILLRLSSSLLFAGLLLISTACFAVIEVESFSKPVLAQRYQVLIEEMRCPKCQNQNLKDSDSPIAADLRREIRRLLEEGKSDDDISTYLVQRYGDFVRYRPALKSNTLFLWFAPAGLVVIALIVGFFVIRRHRRSDQLLSANLTASEQQQLDTLMNESQLKSSREQP